jgi:excisionase family DNA binding protein
MSSALLTLKDACKILNVPYARAAALARDGILPVVRLGRQLRVDPNQLAKFVEEGGKALPGGWRREAR